MICLYNSLGVFFNFAKDWQTSIVAIITIWFAWYMWEINALVASIDRKGINLKAGTMFPKTFFATHLSHLPAWLAVKVLIHAILKSQGAVTWTHWRKEFIEEHADYRKSRAQLLSEKWID